MAFGPGIIGRGDVVHGKDDDTSRRKIPLAVACTMAGVCNIITLAAYAIKWAGLAQVWWNEYEPYMWVGPLRAWLRRLDSVWTHTAEWIGPQFFLRLRPLLIEWVMCLGALVLFDQLPRILVAEGLVPYSQYDPNAGLLTTWGMILAGLITLFRKEPIENEQTVEQGPITVLRKNRKNRTHTQYRYPQIPTPRAGREMLARWFWRIVREGGVGFSINAAQKYKIQRDEVAKIQRVFIKEEWAEDRGGTQGTVPNVNGLDVMADVVTEIYPTATLPRQAA